ncbi:hypothetical protein BKA57DRAFT_457566 [Linnemannia elongata]|nr:hypothetical protein BKA57DRAFT_457566 [Linnemannia elongata]
MRLHCFFLFVFFFSLFSFLLATLCHSPLPLPFVHVSFFPPSLLPLPIFALDPFTHLRLPSSFSLNNYPPAFHSLTPPLPLQTYYHIPNHLSSVNFFFFFAVFFCPTCCISLVLFTCHSYILCIHISISSQT